MSNTELKLVDGYAGRDTLKHKSKRYWILNNVPQHSTIRTYNPNHNGRQINLQHNDICNRINAKQSNKEQKHFERQKPILLTSNFKGINMVTNSTATVKVETKSEKFQRIAIARVNKSIAAINQIAHLASSNYECTQEQLDKIEKTLYETVESTMLQFNPKAKKTAVGFTF